MRLAPWFLLATMVACSDSPSTEDAGTPAVCVEPQVSCRGRCTDPRTDKANCGVCGLRCQADENCVGGTCYGCGTTNCAAAEVCLNQVCTCGGAACTTEERCAAGACLPKFCSSQVCRSDEVCSQAVCVEAACVGVVCSAGLRCSRGLCATNTCGDGLKNGAETDVDCGGICPRCGTGRACAKALDCGSLNCVGAVCLAPSCTDGIRNGEEGDVDCGGMCPLCQTGKSCANPSQCASGTCRKNTCQPPAGTQLAFATLAQAIPPGSCSSVVRVELRDAANHVAAATAATTISLTTSGVPVSLFSDASCATGISAPVPVAAGGSSIAFYFRGSVAGAASLTATSGTLTSATQLQSIGVGAPAKLAFLVQPLSTSAGVGFAPAPQVELQDALGQRVVGSTASVTLALASNPSGGALAGTLTVAAVAGVATFSNLLLYRSGAGFTLGAASGTLTPTTSAAFSVSPGPATSLAFAVQPTNAAAGVALAPAPTVVVQDSLGNTVTSSTASIVVALAANPSAGTLSGAATVAAAAGVATFSTLAIDKAGAGYSLGAASPGLVPAMSNSFSIAVPAPARLAILGAPLTVPALGCSALRFVELQDLGGTRTSSVGPTVVSYVGTPAAATTTFYSDPSCTTLLTPATRTIASGASQASFYFLAQNATATLTLTASSAGLTSGAQTQTITQATATDLEFGAVTAPIEAGFCRALTLERRDKLGRPTSPLAATTVSLASLPVTGVLLFSNAGCTTPLTATFDIPSGASSTVVYAKGISGSLTGTVPGPQVYGLTASAPGLTTGQLNLTVLPMVRRRSAACTLTGAAVTCPIAPALTDLSRTALFFQATPGSAADNASDDNVTCRLNLNPTAEVVCERFGTVGDVDIEWQTVSFPYGYAAGGVTVQHLASGCDAGALNAMPVNTLVASAPLAQSFVLSSSRTLDGDNDGKSFFEARLTSPTNLSILQSDPSSTCSATAGFTAQVVRWAGATVGRAVTAGDGGTTLTASRATVPGSPTFLLYSSRMTGDLGGNNNLCGRRLEGEITDATTLTFQRGCSGAELQSLGWEHVRLPAGASVQQLQGAIADGATTNAVAITPVDLTRAFAFIGGLGPGGAASGRTDFASSARVGAALARAVLTSAGQLTFTRTSSSGNSAWTGYVVQLTP